MIANTNLLLVASAAVTAFFPSLASAKYCPPLGPVLPPAKQPSHHAAVKEAVKALGERFASDTSKIEASAISIGVKSIYDDKPMVDLHFTPSIKDKNGTKKVDANTIYRIGSATKVFTVLAALQESSISFEDPILKYLPKLKEKQPEGSELDAVKWDEITIGALASHVAGVGRDSRFLTNYYHIMFLLTNPVRSS